MDTSSLDKAMDSQPASVRDLMEDQVKAMMDRLSAGGFDGPTQAAMQQSVEQSLARLKGLIEQA